MMFYRIDRPSDLMQPHAALQNPLKLIAMAAGNEIAQRSGQLNPDEARISAK
jgi:hypothetical protein